MMNLTLKKLLIVAVASAACMSVDAASGQTTTYTWKDGNSNGNWHSRSNWDCAGACPDYPGQSANAVVVIPSATPSPVLSIDLTDVNHHPLLSMTIHSDAQLQVANNGQVEVADGMTIAGVVEVQSGGALRLLEGSDTVASGTSGKLIADGTVALEADTDFALLLVPANTTLSMEGHGFHAGGVIFIDAVDSTDFGTLLISDGTTFGPYDTGSGLIAGFLTGERSYAKLLIADDATLTLDEITLRGTLTADAESGTATLRNFGTVVADEENEMLALGSNLLLDDSSSAEWGANGDGATIEFNRDATLSANFALENGGFILVKEGTEVTTTGTVEPRPDDPQAADGCIIVQPNACFRFNFQDPIDQVDVCDDDLGDC